MFRSKYSTFLTVLLVVAIIAIVIICAVIGTKMYRNYKSEKESKQAISEFIASTDSSNNGTSSSSNSFSNVEDKLNEDVEIDSNVFKPSSVIIQEQDATQQTTTTKPKKVKFYKEFVMIGYIEIPKTGIEYPILTDTTAEALDTSVGVLYPTNPSLNEPGNVVIIGHNYRNGKFFSDNKKLSVGDKIKITDESGSSLTYTIYEIFETTPEDTEYMTREIGENIEISLSTCTDDGTKRLVILAKAE